MNFNSAPTLVKGQTQENPSQEGPSQNLWQRLFREGTLRKVQSKHSLFVIGDPLLSVMIVVSGAVCLSSHDTILDILEPGSSIGGAFMFQNQKQNYPISAQALGPTEYLEISQQKILELAKSEPELNQYLFNQFRQRMEFIQSCRIVQSLSASARVAHFLLKKRSLLQSGLLTRKLIGQVASTTTETVIRTLSDFEKKQILKTQGRKIIILKEKTLEDLCQMSPS